MAQQLDVQLQRLGQPGMDLNGAKLVEQALLLGRLTCSSWCRGLDMWPWQPPSRPGLYENDLWEKEQGIPVNSRASSARCCSPADDGNAAYKHDLVLTQGGSHS